ncbi:FAD-dependent oxidoreductase [Amycolatopsis sp. cmx-4-61]|uniref:FAD-dependent oxidoreductase n=1 Tax=Amycolatopsis sp. cmx-4-61 TaxID=2790937 RepID=UPI00397ACEFE
MKALIIGCGMVGPAAALALRRTGVDPVILEKAAGPRESTGGILNFPPNGMAILDALSCGPRIRHNGYVKVRYADDKRGATDRPLYPFIAIRRNVAARVLREAATEAGIPVEFGKELTGIHLPAAGGVEARFHDGTTVTGDVLLGCDGVHSATRRLLLPNTPKPRYTKRTYVTSRLQTGVPSAGRDSRLTYRTAASSFISNVSATGNAFWTAILYHPTQFAVTQHGEPSPKYWSAILEAEFGDAPAEILRLIRQNPPASSHQVYELPPLSRWFSGSACLLGDAAHASTPYHAQGFALGLEDAVTLAACLKKHRGAGAAFMEYQSVRKARCDYVVRSARRAGWLRNPSTHTQKFIWKLFAQFYLPILDAEAARIAAHRVPVL